jgi:pimeloyl-ACP methyl ester carboxylesterase
MVLVDLRNHGRSAEIEGLEPPHDMVNAANDLAHLVKAQGWAWPDVVIGHSMGGKVALQFAKSCARGDYGEFVSLPKQVFLCQSFIDISAHVFNNKIDCPLLNLLYALYYHKIQGIP